MLGNLRTVWALLVGVCFMMIGNGLQGTLISLRASIEGFSTFATGVTMSGYFVGVLVGSIIVPKLVRRVGHIRVFAAVSSSASVAVLVYVLLINPYSWWAMRVMTGICYAGIYIVAESWLNDMASNETRGKILSVYMVVSTVGLAIGQGLLNVGDPSNSDLFIFISIVVSLGLVPILLTAKPAPSFDLASSMTLFELYRASPLAVYSNVFTSISHGIVFGLGAIYALQSNFSTENISIFMIAIIVGGFIFQTPLGLISDKKGRRVTMLGMSFANIIICSVLLTVPVQSIAFFGLIVMLGGMVIPMYSMCIAYANDRLEPEQIVAASGTLVMVSGIGLSLGPIIVSAMMSIYGANVFFYSIACLYVIMAFLVGNSLLLRETTSAEDRSQSLVAGHAGTPIPEVMAPDAEVYVEALATDSLDKLDAEEVDFLKQ